MGAREQGTEGLRRVRQIVRPRVLYQGMALAVPKNASKLSGALQAAEKQPFFRPVLVMRKLFAPGVLLWRGFRFSFCLCRPLLPARRDTSPPKLPGIESESACAFAPDCSPPAPADRTSPPGPTRVTSPGAAARSASTTRTSSQSACACSG